MDSFNTYKMVSAFIESNVVFMLVGGMWGAVSIAKVSIITSISENHGVLSLFCARVLGDFC